MARKPRSRTGENELADASAKDRISAKQTAKKEFSRRLYKLMVSKGWHQSELARRADIQRAAISTYIRAAVLPDDENLEKLAKVFDMKPEELEPTRYNRGIRFADDASQTPEAAVAAFEVKASSTAPNLAFLRVNKLVYLTTALKVAELLQADDAAIDGNGSR